MSTKIRGLPPRIILRNRDAATGSYPSIPRTGDDSRTGAYNVFYNDINTINFLTIDSDSSSSVKRPAPFDLRSNQGFYQSSDGLIAYYRFKNNFELTGSDKVILTDLGQSGTLHLTSSYLLTGSVFTYDSPSSGSVGAGIFGNTNQIFAITEVATLQEVSKSFSFGNGTSDYSRSISVWLKKNEVMPTTHSVFFAASGSDGGISDHYDFGVWGGSEPGPGNSGNFYARFHDSSQNAKIVAAIDPLASGRVKINEWFHYVITYDGSGKDGIKFYINGDYIEPVLTSGSLDYVAMEESFTLPFIGGAGTVTGSKYWKGEIDNFAIFDSVIGEHEIKELAGYRKGISLPTGLDSNSKFLNQDHVTDIFVNGSIKKGVIDNFISFTPGENITPFNETFRPEQSQDGLFFKSGSLASETTLGFSNRLASKTQIRFSFNVDSLTTMNPSSASIVYYNKNTKTFDLIGGTHSLTDPGAVYEVGCLGRDCRLFNAIGMPIMSGTSGLARPSPFHGSGHFEDSLDDVLNYSQQETLTLNPNFSATDDQLIPMSGVLNSPFLLEKAVIELSVSSSNGWFEDFTRSAADTGGGFYCDLGGPGVTVSIMNQLANNKRELILSSTIIPNGDTGSFSYTPENSLIMPAGFGSFATPGAIVSSMGVQKVQLAADAAISNGVLLVGDDNDTFNQTTIGEVSQFGRSLNPKDPSGHSFFGKEYTAPLLTNNSTDFIKYDRVSLGTSGDLFQYEKHARSPYLLFPEDNLILSISKYRPILSDILARTSLTGSHEFGLPTGVINIILYGSQIKEGKEFHDSLNQNLTSDAIHEYIHFDNPVIDQYDIESRSSFSGSYIAEFFTGSMLISGTYSTGSYFGNGYLDAIRGVETSIIGTSNKIIKTLPVNSTVNLGFYFAKKGFNKNVQLVSDDERYFDTLVPKIDQISTVEGADIINNSEKNYYLLGSGTNTDYLWITDWDFSFPFEPKYSNITRTISPFKNTISTKKLNGTAFFKESNSSNIFRPRSIGNGGSGIDFAMEGAFITSAVNTVYLGVPNDLLSKTIYGIGNGQYGEPVFITNFNPAGSPYSVAYNSETRGFKYGLLNANKEMKKWHFRRDHFGQFRDMLEQAKDSKIFITSKGSVSASPIRVRFVGNGNIVLGEETFSNNISNESTSSLPYFDGISRSRGDLPDTNIVP